jgi:hypothetical protein
MQSRPKLLVWSFYYAVAYVSDDSTPSTGIYTRLSRSSEYRNFYGGLQLVGTCNGLICVCDNDAVLGGALTLLNPVTGETLDTSPTYL